MAGTLVLRVRMVSVVVTIALAAGLAVAVAPGAGAVGTSTGKTGAQPAGQGLGSKSALAQSTCNTTTKRTSFYIGMGTGPFCVNPWKAGANNGGATAPGVSATEVKVVVYVPTATQLAAQRAAGTSGPVNQVTNQPANWQDNFKDFDTVYQYAIKTFGTYQTWGRHPVYEYVEASGTDEAAQRADALAVIAKKPFIVLDAYDQSLGAPIFESEIAKAHIIVDGAAATSLTATDLAKQAPYRWAIQSDSTASLYLVSSFLGTVSGQKAQYAGDTSLQGKTRAFGLVTPTTGVDVDLLKAAFKKDGVTAPAAEVTYDPTATATFDDTAKTNIAKLQSAGVTSVILVANQAMDKALMAAATSNNFKPEWIETGYQFSDYDGFARNWDQDQASHAFGIGVLNPLVTGASATTGAFQWYWGTKQGNISAGGNGFFSFLYGAIQYAGPKLTVANVQKGLFSVPAVGGASDGTVTFQTGYGRTVGLPYDEYFGLGTDVEMIWWNPNSTGGANAVASAVGKGKWAYLNNGKRYSFGSFPKGAKFFDLASSVDQVPLSSTYLGGVAPAANPCGPTCPSTTGG
jgi:hypothetical protein